MKNNPAVSVIIPMYNAQDYIGECLDSILGQTFQDFEVIAVDDCSTDLSVAIVEEYAPKFGGRLRLARTKENSGGGGYVPRNIGLNLSCGEYIFFVDSDDFIVETALEILHAAATQTQADVVYTSKFYFYLSDNKKFNMCSDSESTHQEDKPILTTDDPNKNLERLLLNEGILHMPWPKVIRRDFLTGNRIDFPKIISSGDFIWTIQVMYYTKRFLRLPIALYFYRDDVSESVTRKHRPPSEQITTCIKAFLAGAKALQSLSNKIDLLKQKPSYVGAALRSFFMNFLGRTFNERMPLNYFEMYEMLYREFNKDSMVPFFFSVLDAHQKELLKANQRIAELEDKLKAKE